MTIDSQPSSQAERNAELEAFVFHLVRGEVTVDHALARLRSEIVVLRPLLPPSPAAGRLLAALAATRPEAVTLDIAEAFASVIERADLTRTWQPGLDAVFEMLPLLISTPAAGALPALIANILASDNLHPRWARRVVALLEELRRWRLDLIDPGSLVSLAESAPESARGALIERVVCPVFLADPARLDSDLLHRATVLLDDPLKARYLAAAIAAHADSPPEVRAAASAAIEQAFPLRRAWRRLVGDRALQVLCVQNITDGQGDEITRVVPLLQALLDDHDDTTIRLITDRSYLYDHPRLGAIGFDDRRNIERALSSSPDVLIELSELNVRHLNYDTDLIGAVARLRASSRPLLDIQAGKGWNDFTFDHVRLGGQEWASALELNRTTSNSVYATTFRLITELGLPVRLGQMARADGSILLAENNSAGENTWDALMSGNHWLFAGAPQREQPCKTAWLRLLERNTDPIFHDLISEACRNDDPDVRLAGARALSRMNRPDIVNDLLALLADPSRHVRGTVADGLLTHHRGMLGTGGMPEIPVLEAYRLIADMPPSWQQVSFGANQGRPALEAALWGDDPVIRREAAVILEIINHEARTRNQTDARRW